jgi:hypothetical protein
MEATAKKITAIFLEDPDIGKATNQKIVVLLGVDAKKKITPKDMFGYLMESEDEKLNKYPFTASSGSKEKELIVDYGAALEDDPKETPSKPMGFRYAKLVVVQDWVVGGMLTLTAGEDRFNFKIQSVENAF